MTDDARRRAELAAIHVAKKQLRFDDATYRAILCRVAGVDSSSRMNDRQRRDVIHEFKRLGWRMRPARDAGIDKLASSETARKIRACWLDLKNAGVLHDASERALIRFAQRMTGRANGSLDWLTAGEAQLVIEALKQWRLRGRRGQASGGEDVV